MWNHYKNKIYPYLLVLPILLVFTLVIVIPMLEGLRISFTDWDGIYSVPNYVGFDNYIRFFKNPDFYNVLLVTVKMGVIIIFLQNAFSIFLAIMLQKNSLLNSSLRSLFFIPGLLTTIVIGLIFSYIFSSSFGIINLLADKVGLDSIAAIDWLGDTRYAFISVVITSIWQSCGISMMIYMGSLKNIPLEYYESAYLDGVTAVKKFRHITFPLLAPAVTVNMLMSVINCIKIFDIPFVMTKGGPAGATKTIAILLYEDAFYGRNAGYAAAESFALLLIIFIISILQSQYFRAREVNL